MERMEEGGSDEEEEEEEGVGDLHPEPYTLNPEP